MQLQYLPGGVARIPYWRAGWTDMHFSSDVINIVFVLNCIRLRSWLMLQTTHCLLRCKRHSIVYMKSFPSLKRAPLSSLTSQSPHINYPDALLKFTKDHSSHAVIVSSFRFFVCFRFFLSFRFVCVFSLLCVYLLISFFIICKACFNVSFTTLSLLQKLLEYCI